MVDFTPTELFALRSNNRRIGVFFRLETDPVVRLWLGIGNFGLAAGVSARDPFGAVYNGLGELVNVPSFNQVINGQAERIELSLSGVREEVVALAVAADAEAVKHKAADIGFGILDVDWVLLGNVHWLRRGYCDYLKFAIETSDDDDTPETHTIGLSISSLMTGRRRAPLSHWTDQHQQRLSLILNPSQGTADRFCERTVNMTEYSKTWPRFD